MVAPPTPENEAQRLESLRALQILDTDPEESFDRITRLAVRIFDVPIATVSLVDEHREWFKARCGIPVREQSRKVAFCAHTILEQDVLVVEDTAEDPRFEDNPAVTASPAIRFYAGAPLRLGSGLVPGTLCIKDHRPRTLDAGRVEILRQLADVVADEMNHRLCAATMRMWEHIFAHASWGIAVAYGDGETLDMVNPAFARMHGATVEELAGRPIGDVFAPGHRTEIADHARRVAAAGRHVYESVHVRADGTTFPVRIDATAVRDEQGRMLYRAANIEDISERVRAERVEEEHRRLEVEVTRLREEVGHGNGTAEFVVGSTAMACVEAAIERVAPTDTTVLVTGETGTGKELAARAIHRRSRRHDAPMIKVNCAALPASLIESELFGHEKGAFTGASARRPGRFELADGGTILLDEIGDLPLELQAKLLRVLQEGDLERVGGTETLRVDVRVIAATNRDLARSVAEQKFRSDLFYRLNVFPIALPPLRERRDDIPPLVQHLAARCAARLGRRIETIPPETMDALVSYRWPGNVRELENVVERGVILSNDGRMELEDWPPRTDAPTGTERVLELDEVQRRHIVEVLEMTGWRVRGARGAAALLGLKPTTLEARMARLGIARPSAA